MNYYAWSILTQKCGVEVYDLALCLNSCDICGQGIVLASHTVAAQNSIKISE